MKSLFRFHMLRMALIGVLLSQSLLLFAHSDTLIKARNCYDEGTYDKVIELLESIPKEDRNIAQYWILLGDALQKKSRFDEAIQAYNEAQRYEKSSTLFTHRGSAKIWSGDLKGAQKDLQLALDLDPSNHLAHYYTGVLHYQAFRSRQAITWLERSIAYNAKYAPAHFLRGAAYAELQQKKEALADMETAFQLDTTLLSARYNMGVLKFDMHDYEGAREEFSALEQTTFEDKANLFYFRAECNHQLKDKHAACIDYEQAAKLGDEVAATIYDKYCLKGANRKDLPSRQTQSIKL